MLSAAQLNRMRATAERALPGTAVIQRGTLTSDGGGGYSEGFAAAGTEPCRVAPATMAEREAGERISSDAEFVVTLPALTDIRTADQLVCSPSGGTLSVVAVRARDFEVTRRIEARRLG